MSLDSHLLHVLRPWLDAPAWRIALSGGLDSSVLLHALVRLSREHRLPPLAAVHVHHGLQAQADAWSEHCTRLCADLGVPLLVRRVTVNGGASLERAAREARYAAFAEQLQAGELLLTAQHLDDQAETLLFRLLRGSGVRGLAAIPVVRGLGAGMLVRPLLGVTRNALEAQARHDGLRWVEDPSNADERYSRNFLRRKVMPLLRSRWPQASTSLARAAEQLGEAQRLLDELAVEDLARVSGVSPFPWLPCPSLDLEALRAMSPARQRNALRHWLAGLGLDMPDRAHWAGWESLRDAAAEADPRWALSRGELRRGAGRLWWVSSCWSGPVTPVVWGAGTAVLALPGNGQARLEGGLAESGLRVAYRQGGERLHRQARGSRDLKRLLNESGLPPFVRSRLPLLWRGETLLAVANLPSLCELGDGPLRLLWTPPGEGTDRALLPPSQV